jgi:hypothetical protein
LLNGTFLGVTFLWSLPKLNTNEIVILWNKPPETVWGNVTINCMVYTPQGPQDAYALHAEGEVSGKSVRIERLYDYDTGLFVDGHIIDDIVFSAMGFNYLGLSGRLSFSATNIDLGSSPQQIALSSFVPIVVFIASTFAVFLLIVNQRKKTKRNRRQARSRKGQ